MTLCRRANKKELQKFSPFLMKYCSLQASVGKEIICAQLLPFTAQLFVKARDRKSAHVFVRFGVCLCVRAPEGGGALKRVTTPLLSH